MKTFLSFIHRMLSLFLVWMLINLGPLNEMRFTYRSIVLADAHGEEANVRDQATLNRLDDCKDVKAGSTEGVSGDKCSISKEESGKNFGAVKTEMWLSTIMVWIGAMISMMNLKYCLKNSPQVKCGWSTALTALAALALIAGEVVAVVMHAKSKAIAKTIDYRPDMLRQNKAGCEAGTMGSGSGAIDGVGVCDQLQALKDQRDAYEAMLSAMKIKVGLQIAAGAAYLIAAIMEFMANAKAAAKETAAITEFAALITKLHAECAALAAPKGAGAAAALKQCTIATSTFRAALVKAKMTSAEIQVMLWNVTPEGSKLVSGRYEAAARQPSVAVPATANSCTTNAPGTTALAKAKQKKIDFDRCIGAGLGRTICNQATSDPGKEPGSTNNDFDDDYLDHFLLKNRGHFAYQYLIKEKYYKWNHLADDYIDEQLNAYEQQLFLSNESTVSPSLGDYHYTRFMALHSDGFSESNFLEFVLSTAMAGIKDEKSDVNANNVASYVLGFAGALAMVLTVLLVKSSVLGDKLYGKPIHRGLWNGAMALSLGAVVGVTYGSAIPEVEKNIAGIDAILKASALNASNVSPVTSDTIPYNEVSVDMMNAPPIAIIPESQPPLPCPGGGDGKGGCLDVGNEIDASLQSLGLEGLSGLSGAVKSMGAGLAGSRDISSGTLKSAAVLAAAHSRLNSKVKDIYRGLQKQAAGLKVPLEDYDENVKRVKNLMNATVKDYLSSRGITPGELVNGAKGPGEIPKEEAQKRLAEQVAVKTEAPNIASAVNELDNFKLESTGSGIPDVSLETQRADAEASALAVQQWGEKFQVRNQDINSDIDADIFKLLSSRYMKTAYPILFEEQNP